MNTMKPRQRRRAYVSVQVDIEEFDDEDIKAEYEVRFGEPPDARCLDTMRRIRTLLLCGQKDAALAAMGELVRDVLGTAI